MNIPIQAIIIENKNICRPITFHIMKLAAIIIVFLLTVSVVQAQTDWPSVVMSKDATPISYEVYGKGEQTLVFVHGWSCDSRYWRAQKSYFSSNYRVVLIDLAGHGHSGSSRSKYTMSAFGEDVQAVVEAIGGQSFILIGHSMGGVVIAQAARFIKERVIGLIGIDTLGDVEYPLTHEELQMMIAPIEKDFRTGTRQFAQSMILPATDPQISDWILADMSAAPPAVGLSAMNEMMSLYITGEMSKMFDEIRIPVVTVNGDLWPINFEANRRHMHSFDAIVLKDADHFLMMNQPEEFNSALEKAINMIMQKNQ